MQKEISASYVLGPLLSEKATYYNEYRNARASYFAILCRKQLPEIFTSMDPISMTGEVHGKENGGLLLVDGC